MAPCTKFDSLGLITDCTSPLHFAILCARRFPRDRPVAIIVSGRRDHYTARSCCAAFRCAVVRLTSVRRAGRFLVHCVLCIKRMLFLIDPLGLSISAVLTFSVLNTIFCAGGIVVDDPVTEGVAIWLGFVIFVIIAAATTNMHREAAL